MKKKKKKTKKRVRVRRGWGAFYRCGGKIYKFFDDYEDAKAFIGVGEVLRVAKCEVREIRGKQ